MPVKVRSLIVTILLIAHGGLLAYGAIRNSFAWNEAALLPSGIWHWRSGNFAAFRVNPPLLRMMATLPVLLMSPELPPTYVPPDSRERMEHELGRSWILANGYRSFWMLTVARWTCIPLSLMGGWVCYQWCNELFGPRAGLYSLAMWCFSPDILAHGQLVTGDLAAASTGILAFYLLWKWLRIQTPFYAVSAGFAFGLALCMKSTWIICAGLVPFVWLINIALRLWKGTGIRFCRELGMLLLQCAIALMVVNGTYEFDGTFKPLGDYDFVSKPLAGKDGDLESIDRPGNRFRGTVLETLPIPFPQDFILGLDLQKWDMERQRWSYLRGQWRDHGWWYYYLYALAIKEPLGLFVALIAGLIMSRLGLAHRFTACDMIVIAIPLIGVLLAASSEVGLNKHVRYVLPVVPFLFVAAGRTATIVATSHSILRMIPGFALVWIVVSSLWIYPHSLSYFNESIGGPLNGHHHLNSSNIDWGQDLLFLRDWYNAHPAARPIHIGYEPTFVLPQDVGIVSAGPPPSLEQPNSHNTDFSTGPLPGWFVIDVDTLTSRDRRYLFYDGIPTVGMAGYSFRIYHISPSDADHIRSTLGLPSLSSGDRANGTTFGLNNEYR